MSGLAVGMAIVLTAFSLKLWRRLQEFIALGRPGPTGAVLTSTPFVSLIVPARNEARVIEGCVRALLAQDYPAFEVIAVDDNSTDETPTILARIAAEDSRLRVVSAPPLPSGWMGKCHALWSGTQHARAKDEAGGWLLFVDADTFALPGLVRGAVAYALARRLVMLSPLPGQDLVSLAERVIQPVVFAMLQLFLPPGRANDPNDRLGHVSGQCLAIRADVYFEIGGHSHPIVRNAISEDTALGQVFKDARLPYEIVDGRLLVRTHMYTNFYEIWNGWAKNFFPGMRERGWLIPFAVFSSLVVIVYFSVVFFFPQPGWVWWLNAAMVGWLAVFLTGMRVVVGRFLDEPLTYVPTWPVGLIVVGGISLASWLRSVTRRGSVWKGRRY